MTWCSLTLHAIRPPSSHTSLLAAPQHLGTSHTWRPSHLHSLLCCLQHSFWNSGMGTVEDEEKLESWCRKLRSGGASSPVGEKELPSDCSEFRIHSEDYCQLTLLCLATCFLGSPWVSSVIEAGTAWSHGSLWEFHVLRAGFALAPHVGLICSFSHSPHLCLEHFVCVQRATLFYLGTYELPTLQQGHSLHDHYYWHSLFLSSLLFVLCSL